MSVHTPPFGQTGLRCAEATEAAAQLVGETFCLHRALLAATEALAAEAGLTAARWQVLDVLRDRARTVAGIARQLGLARQSVLRTARCLEADGFLRFGDNPEHRRAGLAYLTELGTQALQTLGRQQAAWLETLGRDLPPANIRIATGVMRGVKGRLETLPPAAGGSGRTDFD